MTLWQLTGLTRASTRCRKMSPWVKRNIASVPGRVGVTDGTQGVAVQAQHHKLAGLQAGLDQVEIGVRVSGVEELVVANELGAQLLGAGPAFADVELQVDRRRLAGENGVGMEASGALRSCQRSGG